MPVEVDSRMTSVTVLDSSKLDDGPRLSATLPLDLLQTLGDKFGSLRVASSIYRNNAVEFFTNELEER